MSNILIAVDGTDADRTVIDQAHSVFGDDAHYVLVNVRRDPMLISTMSVSMGMAAIVPGPEVLGSIDRNDGEFDLQDVADEATEVARAAGRSGNLADAEAVGDVGLEPDVILATAVEHDVDVIVVGDRNRSWFSKLLTPSVSETVADRSPVPVMVVRLDRPATE